MVFKERLKELRSKRGLTQEQLAVSLGIPESTIRRYESVEDSMPRRERLEKIADFFGVSTDYLTGREIKAQIALKNSDELVANDTVIQATKTFSERLKKGMQQQSLSPEDVATECNVTPEYIQELMTVPKRLPGATTLFKLAMLLDVTPDYLGGFTDDPKGTSPHTPRPKEMTEFLDREEVMFDGVPLTEEDKEKIKNVLAAIFMDAKKRNKRK